MGEVYFDVVLSDVRVYPGVDLFLGRQENHVLVYHEVPVVLR